MNAKRNMRKGLALWAVAGLTSLVLIMGGRMKVPADLGQALGRALGTPVATSRPVTAPVQPLDLALETFDERHELESWTAPRPSEDEAKRATEHVPTKKELAPLETARVVASRSITGTLELPALTMALDENPLTATDDEAELEPSMAGLILN